ncbi:hypothetical protein G7Y79_00069g096380 [Physcia stellaris]|nr:hypothetical protein G7Y79_00069g096380 [Physcia stellaris]
MFKDIMANSNSPDLRLPQPENEVECQRDELIDPTPVDPTLLDPTLVDLTLSPIPSDETWLDYTLPTIPSQVPYNTPDSQLFEIYADSPGNSPTKASPSTTGSDTPKTRPLSPEAQARIQLGELYASLENHSTEASPSTTGSDAPKTRPLSPEAQARIEEAQANYERSFPHGYTIIPTSGWGLLCGWHAIRHSMTAQHPTLPCPPSDELQAIFDANMAEYATVFDMHNENDFSVDQIAGVLYSWGLPRGLNLQIGYLEEGQAAQLVSHPAEGRDEVRVVWIHNDGRWRMRNCIGHYSGMRAKEAESQWEPPEESERPVSKKRKYEEAVDEASSSQGLPVDPAKRPCSHATTAKLPGDSDSTASRDARRNSISVEQRGHASDPENEAGNQLVCEHEIKQGMEKPRIRPRK